jgi:hypothetical protein
MFIKRFSALHLLLTALLVSCTHPEAQKRWIPQPSERNEETQTPPPEDSPLQASGGGGVIDGNGGMRITDELNPWFLGSQPIPYCIERSEEFSLAFDQASAAIRAGFLDWRETISTLIKYDEKGWRSNDTPLRLALDFSEIPCDQGQPLLKFKLGGMDADVEAYLKNAAKQTVGFAKRQSYDPKTFLATGFIWIAPDIGSKRYSGPGQKERFWSVGDVFHNVMLHELGHVFGFAHGVPLIMGANLPARIVATSATQIAELKLSSRELVQRLMKPGIPEECRYLTGALFAKQFVGLQDIFQLDVKDGGLWTMCMTWKSGVKEFEDPDVLHLSFKNAAGTIMKQSAAISGGVISEVGSVLGKYRMGAKEDLTDVEFYSYSKSYELSGTLTVGSKKYPINMHNKVSGGLITTLRIYHEDKWLPFELYDMNFIPVLLSDTDD